MLSVCLICLPEIDATPLHLYWLLVYVSFIHVRCVIFTQL